MFESGFKFILIETIPEKHPHLFSYKYKFKTDSKSVYHVLVERYEGSVYIIKYYPQLLENHKNDYKYGVVLNKFSTKEVSKIIRTNIEIGVEILSRDEHASFGFVGVPKIKAKNTMGKNEPRYNTTRFRIYKRVFLNFFNEEKFLHSENLDNSAYIIINKKNKNPGTTLKHCVEMFLKIYTDLPL